ncbi:MAG TPA: hypothetical protein VMZ50_07255, partial [Phycisphaerae bacterium]|nr:hypothetical protein [Phycisphaerae bacterium]
MASRDSLTLISAAKAGIALRDDQAKAHTEKLRRALRAELRLLLAKLRPVFREMPKRRWGVHSARHLLPVIHAHTQQTIGRMAGHLAGEAQRSARSGYVTATKAAELALDHVDAPEKLDPDRLLGQPLVQDVRVLNKSVEIMREAGDDDHWRRQPRDEDGQWTRGGGAARKMQQHTARQPLVPQTRAFRDWFGDSVVVADNSPMPVYHAAFNDFDVFRTDPASDSPSQAPWNPNFDDIGAWFAKDPGLSNKVAEFYGSRMRRTPPRSVPAFLSIKNPLRIASRNDFDKELYRTLSPEDREHWKDIRKRLGATAPKTQEQVDAEDEERASFVKGMKDNLIAQGGYDGIVIDDDMGNGAAFIAFHPEQIKSATGNVGTFDPREASIARQPQVPQTRAFRDWFGKSKVVDDAGEPKPAYHGTVGDFDTFRYGDVESDMGAGFYFSSSPGEASERYADETGADDGVFGSDLGHRVKVLTDMLTA